MTRLSILIAAASIVVLSTTQVHAQSGTFRQSHDLGFGGTENADPIHPNRFWQVTEKTMNRLLRPDASGVPSPDLAVSWSASDDASVWTFKLREGVKFHDGSDFDSGDVVDLLMRIKDPELASPVASVLKVMDKVEAVDPLTVKITLSAPHADFPLLLMDYRIRMTPEGSGDTIGKTGIGTGPFILLTLDAEGTTILKANPDYWEGPPGIKTVEIISIPDSQARVQALLSGQIDMLRHISGQEKALFEDNPKFKLQSVATGDWRTIAFRTDTKPFTDARVRKALRIAADRQAIIDLVLGPGGGVVACDNPVWSGDQYHAPFDCPQQIDEAKRLLAEAGYPDGIEIDVITSDLRALWIDMVQVYQQQVAQAGITVNLVKAPADGYWSEVWMKLPAVTSSWGQRPADQILNEAYRGGASWNETFWNQPEFDEKLDQARHELDFDKRKDLYYDLQRLLYEEGGSFIPFHINQIVVTSARVSDLDPVFDDGVRYHLVNVSD
ncbi:MAG: ABC transporter substrate-binding protein [Dehalococcoidia bacterium]|nr:ABC transporter substrate-binding protein [Dehalococcoidia bacterium]